MFDRRDPHSFWEFVIAGVLVAVACAITVYLLVSRGNLPSMDAAPPEQPSRTAPTRAEYEAATAEVMAPFLRQAVVIDPAAADVAALADLVAKTKDRAMRIVVPADRRDLHLRLIFLLDAWTAAVRGDKDAATKAAADTAAVVEQEPWLTQ